MIATRGLVAAGHPSTAAAAAEMLAAGGNAFDAAVAAGFAACVAEPVLASLGGGGFLLARTDEGRSTIYDFFVETPVEARGGEVDFHPIVGDFGDTTQEFHIGLGSIATPGTAAGLFEVHRDLGRLPIDLVVGPAIEYARTGVEINGFQHRIQTILRSIVAATPEARAFFSGGRADGRPARVGDRFRLPAFAGLLEALAADGPDLFYRGEIAARLARACAERGGHLTRDDLARYRVVRREPLCFSYRGCRVATNPPPSCGGALIAFSANLLEASGIEGLDLASPQHLERLIRVMELTNQARSVVDATHPERFGERLLQSELLAEYRVAVARHLVRSRGTTHVSVVDGAGDLASLTLSNGEGSGFVLSGTDVMMNNMLGEEDLHPGGFHRWPPGTRLSSMMAPTILESPSGPVRALGSGGSNRLRTAILQVVSHLLDFGLPLRAAIEQPRLHLERDRLDLEPGFPAATIEHLREGYPELTEWRETSLFFGGVHAAELGRDGTLEGWGDARRGGSVVRVPR